MSDTDDTDVLLNSDPMGGLNMFLGLSLKELAEKHGNIMSLEKEVQAQASSSSLKSASSSLGFSTGEPESKPTADQQKNQKNDLNLSSNSNPDFDCSDYLNSKGEIVLSGLSEWTDSSDTETETQDNNDDVHSDGGSESSFTYTTTTSTDDIFQIQTNGNDAKKEDDAQKKKDSNSGDDQSTTAESNNDKNTKSSDSSSAGQVEGYLGLKGSEEWRKIIKISFFYVVSCPASSAGEVVLSKSSMKSQENENTSEGSRSQSFLTQFFNHGRVVDINLCHPAAGWNIPLPKFQSSAETEQIFTRAPNFRTPGGYVPPENPPQCFNLTDAEIQEEVKKMYQSPESFPEDENIDKEKQQGHRRVLRFADEINEISREGEEKVQFNFTNGESNVQFTQPPGDKPLNTPDDKKSSSKRKEKYRKAQQTSRKSAGAGDGISSSSADTSTEGKGPGPLSNSNGIKAVPINSQEKENKINGSGVPYCTKVIRGKRSNRTKKNSNSTNSNSNAGFSFGFGESDESGLSPIRPSTTGSRNSNILRTPNLSSSNSTSASSSIHGDSVGGGGGNGASFGLEELKTIWRDIQLSRQLMKEDIKSAFGGRNSGAFIEDLGAVLPGDSQEGVTPIHTVNAKGPKDKENYHDATTITTKIPSSSVNNVQVRSSNNPPHLAPNFDNFDSELEMILDAADIHPSDFEDIIGEIDPSECEYGAGIDDLLNEIIPDTTAGAAANSGTDTNDPKANCIDQSRLSDWAKSGAVEYVEKYHEEKFRRQECEAEIQKLQNELLNIKERNAVLEGQMKRKDIAMQQIQTSWKKMSTEWKTYEGTTKTQLDRLNKEVEELKSTSDENKLRIQQYEKELMKTVEIADDFKSKLEESQLATTKATELLEQEKKNMSSSFLKVKKELEQLQDEKQTAVRALKESQILFDEQKILADRLESELTVSKLTNQDSATSLQQVLNEKSKLECVIQQRTLCVKELENKVHNLKNTLELQQIEKENLRRDLENSTLTKVKEEGERLHNYYNNKLQDALKSATEKAAKAEATLVESMKNASIESDRKLSEYRERYQADLMRMKSRYEAEIQLLKKDNIQKQLLISTTAQQLQSGDLARSGVVNRLQSLVSAIPPPTVSERGEGAFQEPHRLSTLESKVYNNTTIMKKDNSSSSINTNNSNSYQYAKFVENLPTKVTKSENLLQHPNANSEISKLFPTKFLPKSSDDAPIVNGNLRSTTTTARSASILND